MATPNFSVNGNYDRCPICKGNPKDCPHSLAEMAERLWKNWVRAVVKDALNND